jgi:RNA polymerase sigma factor (sigma-70 family)
MGTDPLKHVLGRLRQALLPPDGGGLSDAQLLGRFVADRDEDAFAALVRRHGPMVLGVCRRILGHQQDAEDAFQAAFLVLARRAASVVKRETPAAFLYGVAHRTALRAKERAARRRATERQVEDMPHPEVPPAEAQDWRPVLDRELDLLPTRYRTAVILCDLEGKTRREAARQLGLSEGTLSSRLARARRLLAKRLARHGLLLSGGALAAALAGGDASAAVPARLLTTTVRAAALVAAGQGAGVATPAAALMNEVLRAMLMTRLKVCITMACLVVLAGAGGFVFRAAGQAPEPVKRGDTRPLTELEVLRREVDILKLQMEVMQEKLRAQDAELRTLKGQAGAARPPAGSPPVSATEETVGPAVELRVGAGGGRRATAQGPPPISIERAPDAPGYRPAPSAARPATSPEQDVDAALQALHEASKDDTSLKRAVDALERAVQRLKERTKSAEPGSQPHGR